MMESFSSVLSAAVNFEALSKASCQSPSLTGSYVSYVDC
jgi:hypothetical protein